MSNGWTLQALIDACMSVTGGCLDCHRHQKRSATASGLMLPPSPADDEMRHLWWQACDADLSGGLCSTFPLNCLKKGWLPVGHS
ncbi:hypothetical protein [Mesorhizobium sp. WSM3879]|uniref:hypothetical protein n=1 Tax=Mesorhizobium sp. WSM3879 TaxID=2029406 RepID=UPI00117D5D0A|nr:hypothetical protein [Mesorhizobium sp. WSM3879]